MTNDEGGTSAAATAFVPGAEADGTRSVPATVGANVAQAKSQAAVNGPSQAAKWACANMRGNNSNAATAPAAATSEYSRPIR